ncbi:MAG: hydrolase [Methylococcaceae bacterium]|nr:hydrolase [Methylococcaceae bacterium]
MTTHPNLLDSGNSILVVVDIQGRLTSAMPEQDAAAMIANGIRLLEAAKILDVPVLLTEQYPEGLGPTATEILEHLPPEARVFEKTGFSCCAADGFNQALAASDRHQVILIGQEAHVCMLQTALELLHQGYQVYVVEDAACSRRAEHKFYALRRMRQQGASIVSYESVLFEWLKDAKHPGFKAISSLLR